MVNSNIVNDMLNSNMLNSNMLNSTTVKDRTNSTTVKDMLDSNIVNSTKVKDRTNSTIDDSYINDSSIGNRAPDWDATADDNPRNDPSGLVFSLVSPTKPTRRSVNKPKSVMPITPGITHDIALQSLNIVHAPTDVLQAIYSVRYAIRYDNKRANSLHHVKIEVKKTHFKVIASDGSFYTERTLPRTALPLGVYYSHYLKPEELIAGRSVRYPPLPRFSKALGFRLIHEMDVVTEELQQAIKQINAKADALIPFIITPTELRLGGENGIRVAIIAPSETECIFTYSGLQRFVRNIDKEKVGIQYANGSLPIRYQNYEDLYLALSPPLGRLWFPEEEEEDEGEEEE